jgi:serine/threonine-protein kinase
MLGRTFLGRYQTTRLLGEGGMGRVYLARQLDLGRQVVVKVMHDDVSADPVFRERFQRETLLMARFQHPFAVTLYDASLDDPQGPCIVMEYIRGVTLDALLLRNGRLSAPRIGRLLGQLCEVLQAAHHEGIIHRDLKPANLMVVDPDTPYEKIKVMDFGLATLIDQKTHKKLSNTSAEFAVGTPGYICPEQVRGEDVDHRGDLYSVGIILYELLTGALPFSGRSSMDMFLAHAAEPPPPFSTIGAGDWVSPALETVVMSCLAKEPSKRPASARELAEQFELALEQEHLAREQQSTEEAEQAANAAPPAKLILDPNAVVHELEAWMPESIAACKLRGFVHDMGGEVIESIPGRIRVRIGGPGTTARVAPPNPLAWLGLSRKPAPIEMDLHLQRANPDRCNHLHITVAMRVVHGSSSSHGDWRARCDQLYCDLRGYLMGQSGT